MKLERKELGQVASKSRRNFRCGAGGQQLILGSILRRGGRHRGHGCGGRRVRSQGGSRGNHLHAQSVGQVHIGRQSLHHLLLLHLLAELLALQLHGQVTGQIGG